MLYRNAVGFAGIALSSLFTLSLARAEEAKPPRHPGPWPIQQGHDLQPRADQLKAMGREDITAQESREIDRLYRQLEANSQEMLDRSRASREKLRGGFCRNGGQVNRPAALSGDL
jgi:hypothetical protein